MKTRRELIKNAIDDSIKDLLYYDRKEDADLPRGAVKEAIEAGEISYEDMVRMWAVALLKGLNA